MQPELIVDPEMRQGLLFDGHILMNTLLLQTMPLNIILLKSRTIQAWLTPERCKAVPHPPELPQAVLHAGTLSVLP